MVYVCTCMRMCMCVGGFALLSVCRYSIQHFDEQFVSTWEFKLEYERPALLGSYIHFGRGRREREKNGRGGEMMVKFRG